MMTVTVLSGAGNEATFDDGVAEDSHLLSERDVSLRSGLPGPLVEALLRPVSQDLLAEYHVEARVYTEASVCRAQLALMMLNADVRMRFIHASMREPRTLEQLQLAVAQAAATGGYIKAPADQPRQSGVARFHRRLLAALGVRRGAANTAAGHTAKTANGAR